MGFWVRNRRFATFDTTSKERSIDSKVVDVVERFERVAREFTVVDVDQYITQINRNHARHDSIAPVTLAMRKATVEATTVFMPLARTEEVTSFTLIKPPRILSNTTLQVLFMLSP